MRKIVIPALVGLLLAACGDDTSTGGGGSGGEPSSGGGGEDTGGKDAGGGGQGFGGDSAGGQNTGGENVGGESTGGQAEGGSGGSGGSGGEGGSAAVCGDGVVDANEDCDDANVALDDGCDDQCAEEAGWTCTGAPSTCTTTCGDGVVAGTEDCDDTNTANLDGCSSMCGLEHGWDCDGEPSSCSATCGDGLVAAGAEECDDSDDVIGDGCDDSCQIELGWSCDMEPSVCTTGCGDGIVVGMEACDDGNPNDSDGCSSLCAIEQGYGCTGSPSVCALSGSCADPIEVTGDGFTFQAANLAPYGDDLDNDDPSCVENNGTGTHPDIVFTIDLDAGDTLHIADSGAEDVLFHVLDGACASATPCIASYDGTGSTEITPGLVFHADAAGTYNVVIDTYNAATASDTVDLLFQISPCGDGTRGPGEECDDTNTSPNDGCSPACAIESGWECTGTPSACTQLPDADCANPIVVNSKTFQYAGPDIRVYGDDVDFSVPASCIDHSTSTPNGYDLVFRVDLGAAGRVRVRDLGNMDALMHILAPGQCGPGTACTASTDFNEDTTGVSYTAGASAESVYVAVESWGSASSSSAFDVRIDTATCGDGLVELGEPCDDGNNNPNDGCSPLCVVEAGYTCMGSPSVCTGLPAANCANPIVVSTNPFTYAGNNIAQYVDDVDFSVPASCADHQTATPNGYDMVFRVDLAAGETVRLREFGTLDALLHILTAGQCGPGTVCTASVDGGDTTERTGLTYTAGSNPESVYLVAESYNNPSAATTFDVRIEHWRCGDGAVSGPETCDDGNTSSGDGCSATCQCETTACLLGTCNGTVVSGSASGLPMAVPDNNPTGISIPINIAATGTIQKVAVGFGATHTWDADLDIFLSSPAATNLEVCTDNGSSGDNFVGTYFVDTAATAITAGSAPFTGFFRPEAAFSAFTGQSVTGAWTLKVSDGGASDVGSVNKFDIAFCVTP